MLSSNTSQVSNDAVFVEEVFSTYLYTGNGTTQTITNGIDLATKGGLTWIKGRSAAGYSNNIFDTARGTNKRLFTNGTNAESTETGAVTAFNTTGFNIGSYVQINDSGATFASWTFRKQPKFFDVVTYTGNGVAGRQISHALASTPGCIIVKNTTDAGTGWIVWHRSINGVSNLYLNTTDSTGTLGFEFLVGTDATVFTITTAVQALNQSGKSYVAYLFAHDAGGFGLTGTDNVISCGSFTGTGALQSINLGWEPQWLLVKQSSGGGGNWVLVDTMRGDSLTGQNFLYTNTSGAEVATSGWFYPEATGFNTGTSASSGATYIYIAIRRGPMKVPTDATKVFKPIAATSSAGTAQTTGFVVDAQLASGARSGSDAKNATFNDRLRGVSTNTTQTQAALVTSSTAAEATASTLQSLNWGNTGFQTPSYLASASAIYWNFQRAPSFFDEVCYTGTGAVQNVTHNLGVAPQLMIVKSRSLAGQEWPVQALGDGTKILKLNSTSAFITNSAYWNDTGATSSVFTVTGSGLTGSSGATYVAYLFATCPGVSKVGSYTGTGTTKQVDCGFAAGARFVLIKRTDSTGDWYVWDSARGIVSGNDPYLLLNSTAAEVTSTDYIDTYSAGFEISSTAPAAINASGGTFIFLAIA